MRAVAVAKAHQVVRVRTAPVSLRVVKSTAPLWIPKGVFTERAANRAARERLAESMADDFVDIIETFRRGIDFDGFGQAVAVGGDVGIADAAIGIERLQGRFAVEILDQLNQAISEGAELGFRFSPPNLPNVPATLVNEAAAEFMAREGAALLEAISRRSLEGVRQALIDQLAGQVSPTEAAARIGDLVGLDARGVKAVTRFRAQIEAQLIPIPAAETAATRAVIERRVKAFADRQLRIRGRLIADTEIQSAIQEGERVYWDIAADLGDIDPALVVKKWFTVQDGRVCPICLPLHNTDQRLRESFSTSVGLISGPPAHPRCRCYLKYTILELSIAA